MAAQKLANTVTFTIAIVEGLMMKFNWVVVFICYIKVYHTMQNI